MKVLLDECVTRYLKRDITGHEVLTVEEAGFKGLKNGQLLQAATESFDAMITVDQNIRYQQNLESSTLAIIVLKAKRSTYPVLRELIPKLIEALERIKPGELITLNTDR